MQQIKEQYATPKNLEARMNIYQFGTNPKPFHEWQAENIDSGVRLKILELGCGTGDLWKVLSKNFIDCQILLSDQSEGMLNKSRKTLGTDNFQYQKIDFHSIPFEDKSFDVIISNHNLYHAFDINKVLTEIRRVLQKNGKFYAVTNSREHLMEFPKLLELQDDTLWPNYLNILAFGAESGMDILKNYFKNVDIVFYTNKLQITDFDVMYRYFLSVRDERIHDRVRNMQSKLNDNFNNEVSNKGYFSVNTKSCLFKCT